MGYRIQIVIDRNGYGKALSSIYRAAETDIASKRRLQVPGVGNVDVAIASYQNFWRFSPTRGH
jgi:hypothetical protein